MMLPDIAPHVYCNAFSFAPPGPEDCAVVWREGALLLAVEDGRLRLPRVGDFPQVRAWQFLFRIDETGYYLCEEPAPDLPGFSFVPQRGAADLEPLELVQACSAAGSLARWYQGTRFCGACGTRMRKSETERAMVCPACGRTVYPTICPSVIVGVTDGERLLLTRYANRPFKRYALVAGFAEIGEPIEDTVRREVLEETGLHVRDLRFYRSQPWGFTDTLLMGFFCRVDGSTEITLQEDELSEATWFTRQTLSYDHTRVSLTGEMIEFFRTYGPEGIWKASE